MNRSNNNNSNEIFFLIMRGLGKFLYGFRMNLLTLITLVAIIFVYHIFFTLSTGVGAFLSHMAKASSVRVYVKNEGGDATLKTIDRLKQIDAVESVLYLDNINAKKFVTDNAPSVGSLSSLSDEFFPAFYEIVPKSGAELKSFEKIAKEARALVPEALEVSYGREYIAKFLRISSGAWAFIIFISALLAFSAGVIIYNTVKLSLLRAKEEIKIYCLVGATRPFISAPFMAEVFFQITLAFFIASGIFALTFNIFNISILKPVGINIFSTPSFSYFLTVYLFVAIICVVASGRSVVSFLKKVSLFDED